MPGPADYFQQGYAQLGQGASDVYAKAREPHPAIQKALRAMLEEGKHPSQAALEAKLEMQGHTGGGFGAEQFAPPPPPMQAYGDGSAPGQPDITQTLRSAMSPQQNTVAAPAPSQNAGPQMAAQGRPVMSRPSVQQMPGVRPFTMQDADDAARLGLLKPVRDPSDTPDDRWARAVLRATTQRDEGAANRGSRETISTNTIESKEGVAGAALKERTRQFDTHHDLEVKRLEQDWRKAVLAARTSIENARMGRASAKDVAALKAVLTYDSAIQSQITALAKATNELGGQLGSSADLQTRLESLKSQHGAMSAQVEDALRKAQEVMNAPPATDTVERSRVSIPGPQLKAPDTSVPAGVGQMPQRVPGKDGHWYKLNPGTGKYRLDANQGG